MVSVLFVFSVFLLMFTVLTHQSSDGFTSRIIHRDSPESPIYDPTLSDSDRFKLALKRDSERFSRVLSSSPGAVQQVGLAGITYFMKFAIGTPPFVIFALVDSGSDLFWIQCAECETCFPQVGFTFDPDESETYHEVQCGSDLCHGEIVTNGDCDDYIGDGESLNSCEYLVGYADNSNSSGVLAQESITLNSPSNEEVVIPNITFGCGLINEGNFSRDVSGIVGLGFGPSSLVSQLASPSIMGTPVFSYCLSPSDSKTNSRSRINFGTYGLIFGGDVIRVQMARTGPGYNLVVIVALTLGTERFKIDESIEKGATCVDSGTPLMYFRTYMYNRLKKSLIKQMAAHPPCQDYEGFLCYGYKQGGQELLEMVIHFRGAVDLKLRSYNVFFPKPGNDKCHCFGISSNHHLPHVNVNLIGSVAQGNFLVGYDYDVGTVSFKPSIC